MMPFGMKCYCKDKISSAIIEHTELDPAVCLELQKIIETIVAPGKGLLACDESPADLDESFQELGIENNESTRRDYREMLLSTNKISKYISGVILHHETVYQKTSNDVEFTEFLHRRNLVPGVKVDKGLVQLFDTENEKTTQGLDNLYENCIRYKKNGCHFAKWRCLFSISERCPTQLAMVTNANVLARYASICQNACMVPVVEPEILNVGEHSIDRALQIHEEMLSILLRTLNEHHVYLEGMILQPAMVLQGSNGIKSTRRCTPQIVAEYTIKTLERTIPAAVPSIFFLSGDQTNEEFVLNLNAINACNNEKPWRLSFCYGHALHDTAIKVWNGKPENIREAQAEFLEKAELCSEASLGKLQIKESDRCSQNYDIV